MAQHEKFRFRSLGALRDRIAALGLALELDDDVKPLVQPFSLGPFLLPNRLVILPMEGCDGQADGSPDELTFRRYRRFAAGGAGLLWFEATAVVPEGRANPRQLWLHDRNIGAFAALAQETRAAAAAAHGPRHRPFLVLQLTHSGRYSRPGLKPKPIIAHHSPFLDPTHRLPPDYPLISDDELERLEDQYVAAARGAREAGFDAVDIKACHRYLVSELLASHTREGRYGGSFENRTRFFRNVVTKVRQAVPGLEVTARLNAYDAMSHPYGFGVDPDDASRPDLREPIALVRFLESTGARLANITIGNPYYNPHVNRPFDKPTAGAPVPGESPLEGVGRFVDIVRQVQQALPGLAVIGGGYSWFRQFFPNLAAANLRKGWVSLIGIGRMGFAYPDCVRDLATEGGLNPRKVCVACSACTQIMRDGGRSGCVPQDATVYGPIYRAGRADATDTIMELAKACHECSDPQCVAGCPAGVDIPGFVSRLAAGEFREAYQTLRAANPLVVTCGYVCPAEVQCEGGCLNQHYSASIPIRRLQQWVGRMAIREGWVSQSVPVSDTFNQKVAVLGAGPAGLAAAVTLAGFGYPVTLFDQKVEAGGIARATIPADRLPLDMITQEIEGLLASCGDRIQRKGIRLGERCDLDWVFGEGHQAICIALGLGQSQPLPRAQRPKSGVESALSLLDRLKKGSRIAGIVRVLGGGNTAIDAALAAQRAGAAEVSVVYRRSFAEMPAWPEERDKAIHAGIHFHTLTAPLDYVIDAQGRLTGLKVVRTRLAKSADGRRPSPEVLPETEHVLPVDLVVEALGQRVSDDVALALASLRFTPEGRLEVQPHTWQTSRPGVFAAGDIINGGTTVVRAVAEGMYAARHIQAFLRKSAAPHG
jgi:NADPH-dependent glutamate synthase beta subunit-like oxidoreductase/2,4-dienoyl-CoA reductase-like NADH-dependent reductase (Old Yellow Enzyme family)